MNGVKYEMDRIDANMFHIVTLVRASSGIFFLFTTTFPNLEKIEPMKKSINYFPLTTLFSVPVN